MRLAHQPGRADLSPATRGLAWTAAGSLVVSVGLMTVVGLSGPSVTVPKLASAAPWPPYFTTGHPSHVAATALDWLPVRLRRPRPAAAPLPPPPRRRPPPPPADIRPPPPRRRP